MEFDYLFWPTVIVRIIDPEQRMCVRASVSERETETETEKEKLKSDAETFPLVKRLFCT